MVREPIREQPSNERPGPITVSSRQSPVGPHVGAHSGIPASRHEPVILGALPSDLTADLRGEVRPLPPDRL